MTSSDPILERYLEEYWGAEPTDKLSEIKVRAYIVRSLTRYLKKKSGGLAAFAEILSPVIEHLETGLADCAINDFMFVSETIGLAKKFVLVQKGEYAGGFRRNPSDSEIAQARALLASVEAFKSEDTDQAADAYSYD